MGPIGYGMGAIKYKEKPEPVRIDYKIDSRYYMDVLNKSQIPIVDKTFRDKWVLQHVNAGVDSSTLKK